MSALPSQTTMVSAFVAIGSVVMALKLVPPDPFESRISVPSEHEQGLHARFYKPSGRRSPFGLMSDEQVQTSLLNPTRLEYFGRALQKTTCTDASACFKNPDSRFVDVGCGDGLATADLANQGFNIVGIDKHEEALRWASSYADGIVDLDATGRVSFEKGSAYSIPFGDRSVDGILAMNLLEHIADLKGFIVEVKRVLRPGGIFAFHTINRSWLSYAVMVQIAQNLLYLKRRGSHDWRLFVTPAEITQLLRSHGFAVQRADFRGLRPQLDGRGFFKTLKLGWGGLISSYIVTSDLRMEYMGYAILKTDA